MRIAVIGSTHAGTAAVTNMARLYPEADITVYERNDNVSFLSCGLALYVGGVVEEAESLFYSSPEELRSMGITLKLQHDVTNVDTAAKTIEAVNLVTGEDVYDRYDKLVIATGSRPIIPPVEGVDADHVLLAKNYAQANTIIERSAEASHITVVGAGYIGVELVEAFHQSGKQVTLIDGVDRILNKYLDPLFTDMVEEDFRERGVDLRLAETVRRIEPDRVVTTGGEIETDLVIMCVGFQPNTDLMKGKIDMLDNGAVKVNDYMQTSDPDIFAAGDCCAVRYNPTGEHAYIPLATNAVRMGTLVAQNMQGPVIPQTGTQGTSGLHLFDLNMASTGLTDTTAAMKEMQVESVTIEERHRPSFMPTSEVVTLRITFDPVSRRLLGGQLISRADVTQAVNTLSTAVQNNMTVEELAYTDFFFQPHFNQPWNFLNKAGLAAAARRVPQSQ
ncbi:FAD-dependent oxidoreductase [Alkalicoccus chagannorensis]|uniref:FAD-dependent oxidoreductase n=1 Tax=Alkalicoccus chagannorensis TaxID=427072 RepID=UPI0004032B32|nr:FAD-dependent oxidoreductase [Alkalicoccus chagannorensis]